ncbi:MAG: PilZ domain-containing protein [Rhodobiaceae bacterium]|nr:PilZ domain-containing protein [Rhodobiaceae bacterium]MCC0015966.1 PilZ domain-containing protein [Rhodobiaceae bacterium]MCC0042442.1 PilZ domain-containing protein [Rhodobiaceae bacterium]
MNARAVASLVNPARLVGSLLGRGKQKQFSRQHQRYACCIVGRLEMIDKGFFMDGSVMELSLGGALFRTASTFMLDRKLDMVKLHFDKQVRRGQIMNLRPEGYGIRFLEPLSEAELNRFAKLFGLKEVDEFH